MAKQKVSRRLAAIMAADVVGYARLIRADEEGTLASLKALREDIIEPKIAEHHGRVVKLMGDGMLAEFGSVVDAVRAAAEVQRAVAKRNADVPEKRRIVFRVGINLGDVVIDGDDIHGDGVNVAARLEGLSEPGGMCVSAAVHDQVRDRIDMMFEDLGDRKVKNIDRPVRVWRWAVDGPTASPGPATSGEPLPLPDKPSIAVLPFDNLSGDPKQNYFSDGITEDIITVLSKIESLFVIARNSSFTFKGKAVKVQEVARDLGVRYVLEGSVQRSKDRVRITVQLVDGLTGAHLWAERYDRDLEDIFALQDEITRKIATELRVTLTEGEQARVWETFSPNLESAELVWKGIEYFRRFTPEDVAKCKELAERAVELDRNSPFACTMLAWTYVMGAWWGWSDSPSRSLELAIEWAEKARALHPSRDGASDLFCITRLLEGEYDQAVAHGEKALALNPNSADIAGAMAMAMNASGKPQEAVRLIAKAKRLSPYYPAWYDAVLAEAHRQLGQYDEALAAQMAYIERNPNDPRNHIRLAAIYSSSGRDEEARTAAGEALKENPGFSLSDYGDHLHYKDPAEKARLLDALRKAGLPE